MPLNFANPSLNAFNISYPVCQVDLLMPTHTEPKLVKRCDAEPITPAAVKLYSKGDRM